MRRSHLVLAGVAGIALGFLLLTQRLSREASPLTSPTAAGRAEPAGAAAEPGAASSGPPSPPGAPPPASLRDTTPDGDLAVDAAGDFVPTPSALVLFDHFLSATGEEAPEVIRARIVDEIRRRVAEPAASEAEALLATYLAYREDGRRLTREGAAPEDLERRLQWIRELRRKHFGAGVADALFGAEERAAELALARRRVAADESLAPEERERRLEALDADLPEQEREARRLARSMAVSKREVDALRASGASDAEVWRARERRFGADAADRLAALDARRSDWQRRYDAYQAERDALAASTEVAALPEDEREARIEALRARHFAQDELVRARALDGIPLPAPSR
jgi:lipase chaperone LimK